MNGTGIIAVIPVKRFVAAKSRLATLLTAAERESLSAAMLEDVMSVAATAFGIAGIMAVTSETKVTAMAARYGAEIVADAASGGLNDAILIAMAVARRRGVAGILVVPSDVPQISSGLLEKSARHLLDGRAAVLAPAQADGGTNLLGLSPPDMMAPAFGPGSFARHRTVLLAAGIEPLVVRGGGIDRDIDRPGDLAAFWRMRTTTRAHACLAEIRIGDRLAPAARPTLDVVTQ